MASWDYSARSVSLIVGPDELAADGIRGDTATLTLHASDFADSTGAWQAVVGSPLVNGAPASGATR